MQAELQTRDMSFENYNHSSAILRTRLDRLLRERELRRSNRSLHVNEEGKDYRGDNGTVGDGQSLVGGEWLDVEQLLDGIALPKVLTDSRQYMQNGRPPKQRLLVVANRLPVSANRRGEDSWALEVSVGGLVSALLGKHPSIQVIGVPHCTKHFFFLQLLILYCVRAFLICKLHGTFILIS